MKSLAKYIPLLGIILATLGFSACQDDFDNKIPAFVEPVAEHQANMSILDLKKLYWRDGTETTDLNYCESVGFLPGTENEHIYISGRVISNDQEGNVFKCLVIQDKTAAIAFSINQYDLSAQFRPGQEVVVDVTGMYIGKYRGLLQLGLPKENENTGIMETSFMPLDLFLIHCEKNGFPEPSKIDTLAFSNFSQFSTTADPEVLMKYQSQLVRFNNVYFENANGTTVFSTYKSSGVDQNIVDENQAKMVVRTSGYCNFWNNPLPMGNGDVVAILSFYGSKSTNLTWQLVLNDLQGCMNFGNPTVAKGSSKENPYTIDDVIEMENNGTAGSGWVTGYIVGAVKPEVSTESPITSNDDIEWTADVTLANTIVIAPSASVKDISMCLVVPLPQNSKLREYGNLVDHPDNYGKQMWINGKFEKYLGAKGVSCSGAASDFEIEGVDVPGGGQGEATGDGSEANPYTVTQIIGMNPSSTTEALATGVWVTGYIVGYIPTGGSSTLLSEAVFSADNATNLNLVLAPTPSASSATQCIGVQLPTSVRGALNLQDNPGNLGAQVAFKGDIYKYCGGPGLKNMSEYKFLSGGGENPDPGPDVPVTDPKGDGTVGNPFNVAKTLEVIKSGNLPSDKVYVEGIISSIKEVDTGSYGNASYYISDDGKTAGQFYIFRGYSLGNKKFTSADEIKVGDKVVVYGELINYMGNTPEMAQGNYIYSLNGNTGGGENPPTPSEGLGTENAPISVTEAIAAYIDGEKQDAWVQGYIVGAFKGTSPDTAEFSAEGVGETTLIIAASAGENNLEKCVAVQLSAGDMRTTLNLKSNPDNLGKQVKLHGSLEKYFKMAGLKSIKSYTLY